MLPQFPLKLGQLFFIHKTLGTAKQEKTTLFIYI